ncbi:hypothetical protein LCGC14_2693090 [marine sediment metagenome]|uniref:Uncharacterized protein n=1 Tax=marine sediment metagenome TaxID=412755 RepID=A0A0F8ZHZ7_9ZZZZ
MSVSTCRDCATRAQLEKIENMVFVARGALLNDDLDKAYRLLGEARGLLETVIAIQKEL